MITLEFVQRVPWPKKHVVTYQRPGVALRAANALTGSKDHSVVELAELLQKHGSVMIFGDLGYATVYK
jgi:hypothetical protein